ncbi:hypothetical protein [Roseinatronobacter alkalisoli]|uniref:Type II secretion system protein GspC N-terminal domain-containing protein n=1 Tax=Roseinatronobacter alkalisoli TaxID=3028235 RepID=A0ABT5TH77_9RHOB|nr:hypothetical protein [Roseinatronobacter sp. HJB301]MDD7973711.1 hypothetical protein [Roseinatronobacter sp. HJB301]
MSRLPPLGFFAALIGATGAILLQSSPPVKESAPVALSAQPTNTPAHLATPARRPVLDPGEAVRNFALNPLLAEGRKGPEPISPDPETHEEVIPFTTGPDLVAPTFATETHFEENVNSPPPPLLLSGYWRFGDTRRVLIRNQATGEERWFAAGEKISDWTLVEMTQNQIVLELGGEVRTIKRDSDIVP